MDERTQGKPHDVHLLPHHPNYPQSTPCRACAAPSRPSVSRSEWEKVQMSHVDESAQVSHCLRCGRSHVVTGLDSVLLETRPTVRQHACGVGGPGSTEIEQPDPCDHIWEPYWDGGGGYSATDQCRRCGVNRSGWECAHEWLDRPESDTRECLICGVER